MPKMSMEEIQELVSEEIDTISSRRKQKKERKDKYKPKKLRRQTDLKW